MCIPGRGGDKRRRRLRPCTANTDVYVLHTVRKYGAGFVLAHHCSVDLGGVQHRDFAIRVLQIGDAVPQLVILCGGHVRHAREPCGSFRGLETGASAACMVLAGGETTHQRGVEVVHVNAVGVAVAKGAVANLVRAHGTVVRRISRGRAGKDTATGSAGRWATNKGVHKHEAAARTHSHM